MDRLIIGPARYRNTTTIDEWDDVTVLSQIAQLADTLGQDRTVSTINLLN